MNCSENDHSEGENSRNGGDCEQKVYELEYIEGKTSESMDREDEPATEMSVTMATLGVGVAYQTECDI